MFFLAAHADAATSPSQATVIILSRSIGGTSAGNGFVVGDGSIIITARHIVFPQQLGGLHQGDAFVTIVSPHLGDAAEADVVAQDRTNNVVILRWRRKGHPALQLADEKDVLSAEKVEVTGYGDAIAAITAGKPQLLAQPPSPQSAELDVNSITVRRGVATAVVTESAPPGAGWAGAPIVLAGSGDVAGCFLRTQADGSAGVGASAGVIRALIPPPAEGEAVTAQPQADVATARFLQSLAASSSRDAAASFAHLQAFLELRPQSAVGHRDAAGQARALGRAEDAQNFYAKALELDPSLISARVLYAQLLHERIMPTSAIEQLRRAWQHGRGSTAAVIPLVNILREQGKEQECVEILASAVQKNPNDSHLWNYLGQSRKAMKDRSGAAAAFTRSADLLPNNATVRLQAAEEFIAAGKLAEAEEQYRLLIARQPENPSAHYFLARLLARTATRKTEALAQAKEALRLSDRPGAPPREAIQALIEAINTGRASGDELRL